MRVGRSTSEHAAADREPSRDDGVALDQTEPFGIIPPNQNPSGLGVFTFNLRFPRQYFDQETLTYYNGFRHYSPAIGRYVQSDPIGLQGGLNGYLSYRWNGFGY